MHKKKYNKIFNNLWLHAKQPINRAVIKRTKGYFAFCVFIYINYLIFLPSDHRVARYFLKMLCRRVAASFWKKLNQSRVIQYMYELQFDRFGDQRREDDEETPGPREWQRKHSHFPTFCPFFFDL